MHHICNITTICIEEDDDPEFNAGAYVYEPPKKKGGGQKVRGVRGKKRRKDDVDDKEGDQEEWQPKRARPVCFFRYPIRGAHGALSLRQGQNDVRPRPRMDIIRY